MSTPTPHYGYPRYSHSLWLLSCGVAWCGVVWCGGVQCGVVNKGGIGTDSIVMRVVVASVVIVHHSSLHHMWCSEEWSGVERKRKKILANTYNILVTNTHICHSPHPEHHLLPPSPSAAAPYTLTKYIFTRQGIERFHTQISRSHTAGHSFLAHRENTLRLSLTQL